jgi:hypothetical protein
LNCISSKIGILLLEKCIKLIILIFKINFRSLPVVTLPTTPPSSPWLKLFLVKQFWCFFLFVVYYRDFFKRQHIWWEKVTTTKIRMSKSNQKEHRKSVSF